ncbi:MAG TPA: FAD/NAD(P)-binding oxidoreductase [Acidimicrobiales bacterium]
MTRALVLGGGFGGLAAAHELRRLLASGDEVVLVDARDEFFMGFAKLWDLGGIRPLADGTRPLAALDGHGIRFVNATIDAIDPSARRVETSAGPFDADAIVVALGAGAAPAHLELIEGASVDGMHRAFDLYDAASLPGIHAALDEIGSGRVVVAVLGIPFKCPPAPYEAALLVDERLRERDVRDAVDIAVVTPVPITIPAVGPDASQYVASFLDARGIDLRTATTVSGVDAARGVLDLGDAGELDYQLLLGVPASAPPRVIASSPLGGEGGWIAADPATLATGFERVYAVGDCTRVPTAGGQLPKAGVFAAAQGTVAARNAAADLGVASDRAIFDGYGYCFMEVPGRKVATVEGNFYGTPKPDVSLSEPDEASFARKQAFEQERLDEWLGEPSARS